jgi:hypothetical protein
LKLQILENLFVKLQKKYGYKQFPSCFGYLKSNYKYLLDKQTLKVNSFKQRKMKIAFRVLFSYMMLIKEQK